MKPQTRCIFTPDSELFGLNLYKPAVHFHLQWTCRLVKWTYEEWPSSTLWTRSCRESVLLSSRRLAYLTSPHLTSLRSCLLRSEGGRVERIDSQIALFCWFHMDHHGLNQSFIQQTTNSCHCITFYNIFRFVIQSWGKRKMFPFGFCP